jgi:hypothetical protein
VRIEADCRSGSGIISNFGRSGRRRRQKIVIKIDHFESIVHATDKQPLRSLRMPLCPPDAASDVVALQGVLWHSLVKDSYRFVVAS